MSLSERCIYKFIKFYTVTVCVVLLMCHDPAAYSNGEMGLCILSYLTLGMRGPYNMHLSLQDGETPLMWATREGDVELVKLLLDGHADVNMQGKVNSSSISHDMYTLIVRAHCNTLLGWEDLV